MLTFLGNHTLAVQKGLNLGVILFIVSEALFFMAIFWAFFHSALTPTVELGAQWPPLGIEPVNPFELPLLNTVILLSSGATITYAHHSLIQGDRKGSLYGSIATVILALIFTGFQGLEYSVSSFTISDGAFGTCFFFGTGFHGLVSLIFNYNTIIHSICPCASYKKTDIFCYNGASANASTPVKGLSAINKRFYSALKVQDVELSPNWVTGFAEAESSFSLKTSKKSTAKSGWSVIPEFRIELHSRDTILLRKIKDYFGVGIISERLDRNIIFYSVQSVRDILNVIIPHFDKYPLITQKKADYILFKEAINLLDLKVQSNIEGIYKIMEIKASMNKGLSDKLKDSFPTVYPVDRPLINFEGDFHPDWLTGFTDGEGCFYVNTKKANTFTGYQIIMTFSITQHVRDERLLTKIIDYLECGNIEKVSTRPNGVTFVVYKFTSIKDKIIPFFCKYPLQGIKSRDFEDFCKIADMMITKEHLTLEGIKKIKSLKSGMNSSRIL